jgi:hypothetical protein
MLLKTILNRVAPQKGFVYGAMALTSEAAAASHASWDAVYRAVDVAVTWGLAHRSLSGIEALGIDEVQWHRGHHYLTLVYQIDAGVRRLLWVALDRTEEAPVPLSGPNISPCRPTKPNTSPCRPGGDGPCPAGKAKSSSGQRHVDPL